MSGQQGWKPERLRDLDRAVAEARGWTRHITIRTGRDREGWQAPNGDQYLEPPTVSLGTRETFELMEEAEINVECMSPQGELREWWANAVESVRCEKAPTPAIAVCLAYLASKGRATESRR